MDTNQHKNSIRLYSEEDVSWLTILFSGFSILAYIADLGSDVFTTYLLFKSEEYVWCGLSFALTLGPALIVNFYSILWWRQRNPRFCRCSSHTSGDETKADSKWTNGFRILSHALLCGIVARHVEIINLGLSYKRAKRTPACSRLDRDQYQTDFTKARKEAAHLQLFECFIQDAPQFTLQVYIWAKRNRHKSVLLECNQLCMTQLLSITFSLISFSSSIVNFQQCVHALKEGETKLKVSFFTSLIQFTWRLGTTGARIYAVILGSMAYPFVVLAILIAHWVLMTMWFRFWEKGHPNPTEKFNGIKANILHFGYDCLMGAVFVFCYLNLVELHSAMPLAKYYILTSSEDILFILLWYFERYGHAVSEQTNYWKLTTVGFIYCNAFFIGLSGMVIYYSILRRQNTSTAKGRRSIANNNFAAVLQQHDTECKLKIEEEPMFDPPES